MSSTTKDNWYPETLKMQHAALTGIDLGHYWRAGQAPIIELIAALDPFHRREEWSDLSTAYGDRVSTSIIDGASHALFPEQPQVVPDTLLAHLAEMAQ